MNLNMGALKLESDCKNDEIDETVDADICDANELDRIFVQRENILEKEVANNKYIMHIGATEEADPNVALALSNNSCEVYNFSNNQIAKLSTITDHNDKIIDCKFNRTNSNLLYTGSSDGTIKVWDLRTPSKSSLCFLDDTVSDISKVKSLNCFDISSNERLLAAGTDLFEGDAFILFWDIRGTSLLGGYWESHTDDVTQVKFHPSDSNKLISGSTDGLINIYDLSQSCEDDALIDSLNTESSVEQLFWFNDQRKDKICCITHTVDLQLWDLDDAEPYKHIPRSDIAKEIMRKNEDCVYLANVHDVGDSLLVLAGSNSNDGNCLRSLKIKNGKLQPSDNFKGNGQIVRSSWYNKNTNILITGGEKGILNIWRLKTAPR